MDSVVYPEYLPPLGSGEEEHGPPLRDVRLAGFGKAKLHKGTQSEVHPPNLDAPTRTQSPNRTGTLTTLLPRYHYYDITTAYLSHIDISS